MITVNGKNVLFKQRKLLFCPIRQNKLQRWRHFYHRNSAGKSSIHISIPRSIVDRRRHHHFHRYFIFWHPLYTAMNRLRFVVHTTSLIWTVSTSPFFLCTVYDVMAACVWSIKPLNRMRLTNHTVFCSDCLLLMQASLISLMQQRQTLSRRQSRHTCQLQGIERHHSALRWKCWPMTNELRSKCRGHKQGSCLKSSL